MAENKKTLNTRISLKYGPIGEWSSTFKPLKGEVCFAEVATEKKDAAGNIISVPAVVFKVGDGEKTFGQLPWASALAADVYDWAKAEHLALNVTEADATNDGKYVNGLAWDSITHTLKPQMVSFDGVIDDSTKESNNAPTTKAVKTYVDNEVKKAVSGGVEGLATKAYVDTAIEAVADDLAEHEQAFGEFQTANTKAITDAVAAEAKIARAAEKTNADAIAAIKDDANIDSFADVVAELAKKQDTIPANTYDAYGSASVAEQNAKDYANGILGTSSDKATANTVYGAKAAAAAAQSDATIAKTKIETFLGTITPDGSTEMIDTLTEINKYVGDHGEEFAELSKKVTNIEDGTTKINADKLDGKDATDFIWKINSTSTIDVAPVSGIPSNPQISLNVEGTKTALGLSNYKTVQTAVADPTANGKSLTFIDTISQNTNGVITATKKNVNLDDYALKSELPTVNDGKFTVSGTGALTGSGEMTANQAGNTTATLDLTDEVKGQINGAVQEVTAGIGIKAVKTGTTVNLELVGKDETDDDGNTVTFIFDCGGAE